MLAGGLLGGLKTGGGGGKRDRYAGADVCLLLASAGAAAAATSGSGCCLLLLLLSNGSTMKEALSFLASPMKGICTRGPAGDTALRMGLSSSAAWLLLAKAFENASLSAFNASSSLPPTLVGCAGVLIGRTDAALVSSASELIGSSKLMADV